MGLLIVAGFNTSILATKCRSGNGSGYTQDGEIYSYMIPSNKR